MKKKNLMTIGFLLAVFGITLAQLVGAGMPQGGHLKIFNITTGKLVGWWDREGTLNTTDLEVSDDVTISGEIICTDCIGDSDVSNTLTASNLIAGSSVVSDAEVDDTITIDGGTINLGTNTYSGLMGVNNLTKCADTQILKMSGSSWACAADATGGDGVDAYVNTTGDTMTGNLIMNMANITLNHTTSYIKTNTTLNYFRFDSSGNIEIGLT